MTLSPNTQHPRKMIIQKKICILGDFAVGKTSLIRRFVEDKFDDKYFSTIGVKISRKTVAHHHSSLHLLLWDLAGGDDFSQVGASYLRGAAGALIVCDLTRRESLSAFAYYSQQLRALQIDTALILVGNKADLVTEHTIHEHDLQTYAAELNVPYLLTSAKTGHGVEAAFRLLTERLRY